MAILWLVALLTLLATAVAALTVAHRRVVERYAEAVQADDTIDSAMRVVLLRVLTAADPERAWPLGQPRPLDLLDRRVIVTISRELGRIDLNSADPDILFAFFAANGWSERNARALAQRIIEWRATDPLANGSAAQATAVAQLVSAGASLYSVTQLRQMPGGSGISRELFDSLTVYAHTTIPLESAATPAVHRALIWADKQQLGGHLWLKPDSRVDTARTASEDFSGWTREVLRVSACLKDDVVSRCRVSVVRLTGNKNSFAQVFVWQSDGALHSEESSLAP